MPSCLDEGIAKSSRFQHLVLSAGEARALPGTRIGKPSVGRALPRSLAAEVADPLREDRLQTGKLRFGERALVVLAIQRPELALQHVAGRWCACHEPWI